MSEQTTPIPAIPTDPIEYVSPATTLPESLSTAEIAAQSKSGQYGNASQSMTAEEENQ
jgi:hypothetical protein